MTDTIGGEDAAVESTSEEAETETPETEEIDGTNLDDVKSLDEVAEEADPDAETDPDEEGEEEPAEMREFDFGGNKMELPKGAVPDELAEKIDSFSKEIWADYTRKSQVNADEAKSLSAQKESVEKLVGLNGEALQTYSRGLQLRTEIEQLSKVDLNALWQSDTDQARRVSDALSQKQAEFQGVVTLVGQQETALTEAQQVDLVRRSDEGKALLDKHIANFSAEKAPDVVKYVVDVFKMPQAEADKWATNPAVTIMAYESMLYRRMQTKTAQPKPKVTQAKPVTTPKGGGKAATSRDPANMSVAQMAKHLDLAP